MLLCQTASHINADNAPRKLGQALASCGSVAGYSGMGMTSASLLAGKPTVCIAPGPENHRTASSVEPFSAGLLLNRHAGANLATLPTAVIDHPFQAWDFNPSTFAAGADSAITERNGKGFTVYLQQADAAGSTLVLNIAGAVGQGLKAILGDSVVDANGASIELTEGQTQVSFALVSDSDITADQAGGITVNYQSSSQGTATSNTWGLTLKDAGETENTLEGDFLVKTEKASRDITRLDAQNQEVIVVKAGELYYVRDGQGNLAAGSDQPTKKPILGEVDGQTVIVGYEDIPSDDVTVTTNAIFGGAGKDKINGLADSDLLGGFGGNDEIDGGAGNDMIGGGKGSDNIKGGDGDDYISSSADVIKRQQQIGKDDVWKNYGLPQGKEAISTQALWGTYKDTQADTDGVTVWAGITATDTSRTEGDVIDAGAGDDWVIASWGDDKIDGQGGADRLFGGDGNDTITGDSYQSGPGQCEDAITQKSAMLILVKGTGAARNRYKNNSCLRAIYLGYGAKRPLKTNTKVASHA